MFAAPIEKLLAGEKKNSVQALALELAAGFLRASKQFADKSCEESKIYCYDLLVRVITLAPTEVRLPGEHHAVDGG